MVWFIFEHTGSQRYLEGISISTGPSWVSSSGLGSGMGMMYSLCGASAVSPSVCGRGVRFGLRSEDGDWGGKAFGNGDGTCGFTRATAGWSLFRKLSLTWEYFWGDTRWCLNLCFYLNSNQFYIFVDISWHICIIKRNSCS